jgi:hypothetical protein
MEEEAFPSFPTIPIRSDNNGAGDWAAMGEKKNLTVFERMRGHEVLGDTYSSPLAGRAGVEGKGMEGKQLTGLNTEVDEVCLCLCLCVCLSVSVSVSLSLFLCLSQSFALCLSLSVLLSHSLFLPSSLPLSLPSSLSFSLCVAGEEGLSYLTESSQAVITSMQAADPKAIWLMQVFAGVGEGGEDGFVGDGGGGDGWGCGADRAAASAVTGVVCC